MFDVSSVFKANDPPMGFRFAVVFFALGVIPNPLDIKFQKVSGLSSEIQTTYHREGGQNMFQHRLPTGMKHGNLVLERGLVVGSPLNIEFLATLSLFKFLTGNVLITLLNKDALPLAAWMFEKTYPVKWKVSDLDAESSSLAIDTLELAYSRFQILRV